MIIKNYIKVNSFEEAFELNKSNNNTILSGMMWTRLSKRNIDTIIDLSNLNLNYIVEENDIFRIGALTSLRDIEINIPLNDNFNSVFNKCLSNIIGVQFRNMATIGGTVFLRSGFSDLCTVLLSMDAKISLFNGGIISFNEYINKNKDKDIIKEIILKKEKKLFLYDSIRNSKVDFPILNFAMSVSDFNNEFNSEILKTLKIVVGARPMKAFLIDFSKININFNNIDEIINYVCDNILVDKNIKASKEYRKHLIKVLSERNIKKCFLNKGELC